MFTKVNLTIIRQWLEQGYLVLGDDTQGIWRFLTQHLVVANWQATDDACSLAEQILAVDHKPEWLYKLYIEHYRIALI